jgi:phage terminase large subunit
MSIRGRGYPNRIYLMHNPIPLIAGQQHWLQKRFLNTIEHELGVNTEGLVNSEKAVILKTTYKHNYFVPDTVKNILEGYKQTNPDLYKMWALGEFTELKGGILDNGYTVIDKVPEGIKFLGYGVDFGFANDQTGVVAVWQQDRKIYIKEMVYETGLTNPQLYDRMLSKGINRNDSIIAESARPDQIQELFDLGLRYIMKCKKYAGHKKDAAQYLRGCEIFVLKGSTNLMSELSTWSWETNKDGIIKPDAKPADGNDHLIDALIYRLAIKQKVKNRRFVMG